MTSPAVSSRGPRLFVALTPAVPARAALHDALAPLRAEVPARALAWVPEPNLHLTLRFLGEQPQAHVEALARALRSAVESFAPLTLALGGLGAFPSWRRPAVLWVGVQANVALARLYQEVDDACASLGHAREARDFHPHVTVARVRRGARLPIALAERLSREAWPLSLHTTVNSADLMASELAAGGARYRLIASAPLDGTAP